MQDIKQWGPQDPAGVRTDETGSNGLVAQTPCRSSFSKAEEIAASPSHSLTPNDSSIHEETSSSSEKVSRASVTKACELCLHVMLRVKDAHNTAVLATSAVVEPAG